MPSIAKYRRTWHALLREQGIPEEDRHWLQETLTGKASSREWTEADYSTAIARLQRDAGVHHDSHAHVREDRRPRRPGLPAPGSMATPSQVATIIDVAGQIDWRAGERGPLSFAIRVVARGPEASLRRELLNAAWRDGARDADLWSRLARAEASLLIRALIKEREAHRAD